MVQLPARTDLKQAGLKCSAREQALGEPRVASIEQRLRAAFSPIDLIIEDDSAAHAGHAGAASGGGHFNVLIVSAAFTGKNPLARHRMVYDALDDMMQREIHALSIRAYTEDEF